MNAFSVHLRSVKFLMGVQISIIANKKYQPPDLGKSHNSPKKNNKGYEKFNY